MRRNAHDEDKQRLQEWIEAAKPILEKFMQMLVEEREQEERQITDFFTRTF